MTEDRDLEDPAPRKFRSEDELREHHWKLLSTMYYVATSYSLIHKLFVPLFLSQTRVLDSRYAQVDFWFIPFLLLAAILFREKHLKVLGSFVAGFIVAYAAWDLRSIVSGVHPGWLAWSHALSTLPVGLAAVFLLSRGDRKRSLAGAWAGALVAGALLLVISMTQVGAVAANPMDGNGTHEDRVEILPKEACGLNAFRVSMDSVEARQNSISLRNCGFFPQSVVLGPASQLEVHSELDGTLNVHVMFVDTEGKRRRHRNRILKAREPFVLEDFSFQENEIVALVFSDSRRDLGVVMVLNPAFSGQGKELVVSADRRLKVLSSGETSQ